LESIRYPLADLDDWLFVLPSVSLCSSGIVPRHPHVIFADQALEVELFAAKVLQFVQVYLINLEYIYANICFRLAIISLDGVRERRVIILLEVLQKESVLFVLFVY